jgi:hypothetical protein
LPEAVENLVEKRVFKNAASVPLFPYRLSPNKPFLEYLMSVVKIGGLLMVAAALSWAGVPEPKWVPVLQDSTHGVDLRWGVLKGDGNWQVFVKNFGTGTVHFDYQLMGVPSDLAAQDNLRVHLSPKGKAVIFSALIPTAFRIEQVRLGAVD